MKTLVLLAGQSTRFWPLKDKSLFPICGKTLVEWQIERLKAAGCDDIAIVANDENAPLVKKVLPHMEVFIQEDKDLGTRGALLSALPQIPKGPVMIVAGTDIVDTDGYKEVLRLAAQPGVDGVILGKHMETYFPGGYMTMQPDGRVTDIVEKPGEGNEPSSLVNIVVHVHNDYDALWDAMQTIPDPAGDGYSQTEQTLFATKNYRVAEYRGRWNAVKYPWHLLDMMEMFLKEKAKPFVHPTASIHPSAVIEGDVYIDEGTQVLPHAVINGPAYIGKDCEVRYGSIIRGGSMGDRCVIGAHSEIKGTVLHSDVWTHGTYLGDSVVGNNVSFGTGTVTANLRLDEGHVHSVVGGKKTSTGRIKFGAAVGNDVRVGMKVGINPGIKIGSNSMVSSGVLVTEDIHNNSYVVMKGGHMVARPTTTPVPRIDARDQFRGENPKEGK